MNISKKLIPAFVVLTALSTGCLFKKFHAHEEGVFNPIVLNRILAPGALRADIEKNLGAGLLVSEVNGRAVFMYCKDWDAVPAPNRSITIVWRNDRLESWDPVLVTKNP